jgi:dCTP deaminase
MTILVDYQIKDKINQGVIKVSPFDESLVNPNSVDLRLGGNFSTLETTAESPDGVCIPCVDPQDKSSFYFRKVESDFYILDPGTFVLASLLEDIELPPNICAEIRGKSSLGRLGLDNSSVAGWVDAGWSGVLTIELSNHGNHPIILQKGMKIGQMVFHQTAVCEKPYGEVGRYQRQEPGAGSLGV